MNSRSAANSLRDLGERATPPPHVHQCDGRLPHERSLHRHLPLYEDETRSVAVGYAEVGLAGGLEIAFARKREGGPEGSVLADWRLRQPNDWASLPGRAGER